MRYESVTMKQLTSIEFCAGAGGQAIGLEQAGFTHELLVDNDADCCATLRLNRPHWKVVCADMNVHDSTDLPKVDLFAAGLPCPPFSVAGKQLGAADERNLFPAAIRLIAASRPRFVLIENVRGFLGPAFAEYRVQLARLFAEIGYEVDLALLNAKDFGLAQTRSRVAIVAARSGLLRHFSFPEGLDGKSADVGTALRDLMSANGWGGAQAWSERAVGPGPTIVGGSKKHGGPDLGPTRARAAWKAMGVNGGSIAEAAPDPGFEGAPRLTCRMVARLQGFPDEWQFTGRKTAAYRQIGNAFPAPIARALGLAIQDAIRRAETAAMAAE